MAPDALITALKSLKLYGMADAIKSLSEQSSPAYRQAEPILDMLRLNRQNGKYVPLITR